MRVRVLHKIDRLADDLEATTDRLETGGPRVVAENAVYARDLWRAVAKAKAADHGANFYKRINAEAHTGTGALVGWSAEAGPDGSPKTEFVGVGYRHGVNTDLEQVAPAAGSELARDTRALIARMFA